MKTRTLQLRFLSCVLALAAAPMINACDSDGGDTAGDSVDTADSTDATDAIDTDSGPADVVDDTADVAVGDPDVLVGTFEFQLVPPELDDQGQVVTAGTTSVLGKVSDGPKPVAVPFVASASAGDCTLYLPAVPHCDQLCGGSAACVAEDTCQAYPSVKSVGTVTVTGVTNADGGDGLALKATGGSYQMSGPSLPYPAFAEGAAISIHTSGGDYAPFAIATHGVAPLALASHDILVARDTAIALAWTPPADPSASVIDVKLDISHHGGTKGVIRCATDDDGALDIDASLVTALVDLGFAGLPSIVVTRSTTASHTIEVGRVDLVAESSVEEYVAIPGLVSCNDSSECPDGTTCQDDLTCQ